MLTYSVDHSLRSTWIEPVPGLFVIEKTTTTKENYLAGRIANQASNSGQSCTMARTTELISYLGLTLVIKK